jgi:arylsulfatase A-like enzyme
MVPRAAAVLALAVLPACGGGGGPRASADAPNVLLISIDTQRADHLGFHGYAKPTSPELDAFAAGAVVFEEAEGAAPWTLPALASVMTGEVVSTHNCWEYGSVLDDSFQTLTEVLLGGGYDTACVVSHLFTTSRHGLQQGFVHTDDTYAFPEISPERNVTSQVISDKGIRFLEQKQAASDHGPWFLWLHYFDPHREYMPHAGITEQLVTKDERRPEHALTDVYDGEVRFTDLHVGRVLRRLEELGFADDTIVVLLADHGEEFFDHGGTGHGHSLHRELLHIPLVFRVPGLAARRVSGVARQIDVLPTLLELVGLESPRDIAGRSLVPELRGETPARAAEDGALGELDNNHTRMDSWRTQRYRLFSMKDGSVKLFDLENDPRELTDVAAQNPEVVRDLRAALERAKSRGRERAELFGTARTVTLTPGVQDDLQALGYSGEAPEDAPSDERAEDHKE